MSVKKDKSQRLLVHSKAKVRLYKEYLTAYLSILGISNFHSISIYDMFAGEGQYGEDFGSSIVAYDVIVEYLKKYPSNPAIIKYHINDSGFSMFDKTTKKIDKIKSIIAGKNFTSDKLEIQYKDKEFNDTIETIRQELSSLKESERAIVFLDPYGYKDIRFQTLASFLKNKKTEVLLFIPINNIFRFANKTLKDKSYALSSGKHIQEFLSDYGITVENIVSDNVNFIEQIRDKLKEKLSGIYVDYFKIHKGKSQIYVLYFLTSNKLGYQKMVDVKWNIDSSEGKGYSPQSYGMDNLFSGNTSTLDSKLKDFLLTKRNNREVRDFIYDCGYTAKQGKQLLEYWENEKMILVEGKERKKSGFYISNAKEEIKVTIVYKTGTKGII